MKTLPSVALLLAVPTAILVPGLLSETHASGQEEVADLVQRLTARAERTMEADSLEGMVVLVGVGDDVLLQKGWGRLPGGGLAEADSVFRASPLVEPLSFIAALQLVESGDIELEKPIGAYLEGVEWEGTEVTVHHILSHTSGLIGWTGAYEASGAEEADTATLIGLVKELGVQSAPGECFEYSESNSLLVGALVEKVTGKPLTTVITERILGPAGVESTGFDDDDAPPARLSAGSSHEIGGEQIDFVRSVHPFGEDEFVASALDLMKIRAAISARKIVGDDTVDALNEPKRLNDGSETAFSYGMSVAELGDFMGLSAGGSSDGTTVHFAYYPEPQVSVVVLVAEERATLSPLERDLTRLVLDMPLPGVQDLELDPEEARRYTGSYQVGCTTYVCRLGEDGYLTISVSDRPTYRLLFQGQRTFVAQRDAEVSFRFVVENGDEVAGKVVIDERGRVSEAVRFQ